MAWPTFATVVSAAGREEGLFSSDVSDPFASTDKNVLQLNSLLNRLGRRLARQHRWTQLQRTHYFPTVSGQNHYPLPADFLRIVDGTIWNRSTTDKAAEGASPQWWRATKDGAITASIYDVLRVAGNRMYIHPEPSAAETLAYEYQSSYWVADSIAAWVEATEYTVGTYVTNDSGKVYVCTVSGTSNTTAGVGPSGTGDGIIIGDATCSWDYVGESGVVPPEKAAATVSTDTLWFDLDLLVTGLILEHRMAKGFDTTAAAEAYNKALSAALGGDGLAPPLSVGGPPRSLKLIDFSNVPESGFGG